MYIFSNRKFETKRFGVKPYRVQAELWTVGQKFTFFDSILFEVKENL